ncbi:hypothetical protein [Actinacidiphila epipremni]|uniref:ATP-binding protein n=1 Tax=Actinacidiphila epipremni TaxID=2053013 RepID=A0ABX0ZS34_9ACTN|nr:hypothetical protein [Actinacidiphila epipremni]NJP46041.1 hypothetical protein [Actinacidiphila epipremni]
MPGGDRSALETELAELRVTITALRQKLAAAPRSEQSVSDRADMIRLREAESALLLQISALDRVEVQERLAPTVRFINREHELEQLMRPTCPQYVVLEAPAGYGKTFLLREYQRRLNTTQDSGLCLLASVPLLPGTGTGAGDADGGGGGDGAEDMPETHFVGPNDIIVSRGRLGDPKLVGDIVAHAAGPGRTALTLLFDAMEQLVTAENAQFFWDGTVLALERRLAEVVELRVVFSGRKVQSTWQGSVRHRLHRLVLEPFDTRAVMESVQSASRDGMGRVLRNEHLHHMATKIVQLSGGHPKVISGIVADFAAYGFALDLDPRSDTYAFSPRAAAELAESHVAPALDEIYSRVPDEAAFAMRSLSVFRGFNANVISMLIRENLIRWDGAPVELLGILSRQTWLISPPSGAYPMYRDAIVRLLSASMMRLTEPERYLRLTQYAARLFRGWVLGVGPEGQELPQKPMDQLQIFFAVEALYHRLDTCRVSPEEGDLPTALAGLTRELVAQFRCTFGEPAELRAQFHEILQNDREFWAILTEVGGDAAVDAYARHVQAIRSLPADEPAPREGTD